MVKAVNPGVLKYHADSTWTGGDSYNAGDLGGAGTGNLVPLAGFGQSYGNYVGALPSGNTLAMGNGHNALFLDDNISQGFNGGARVANVDTITAGSGGQLIDLTSGQFGLNVTNITTGNGNDVILNSGGNTTISAGAGDDYVWTGSGNNTVSGGAGNDTLVAGKGNDALFGGSGNDVLVAGAGNDSFNGGGGTHNPNATNHNHGFDTVDFSKVCLLYTSPSPRGS